MGRWQGGGGGDSGGRGADRRASFTGLFVLLAACTMAFGALYQRLRSPAAVSPI